MAGNEIEETAKAVQATAQTAGKAIDATRELGGFFNRIFGGPLEEVSQRAVLELRFRREVRALRLARRYEEFRSEQNIADPHPVEMKFGVPLIEAATLEEDDKLQDMFARLLVTATNPNAAVKAQRSFVTILQDLGPLEALLLDRIYNAPTRPGTVLTAKLPDGYVSDETSEEMPPYEVQLALWNLVRLGCIEPGGTWGGGSTVSAATMTALGRALVEACTTNLPRPGPDEPKPSDWDAKVLSQTVGIGSGHL
jgi:hypothetical protein